ncbi:MAG TPA: MoaD/ThiS family protein [Clostridia bacterium]|nr:MoaD/ThiS family protein [Clostridia bacterium]
MRIKLHFMGALKPKLPAGVLLEVEDTATPRDLLRSLGVAGEEVLVLVNGKPVAPDYQLAPEDRVVFMYPVSPDT